MWEIRRLQEQQELRDSDNEMPMLFDQEQENFQGKRKVSIELENLNLEILKIKDQINQVKENHTKLEAERDHVNFQAGSLLDNFKYRKVTIHQLLQKKQQDNKNLEQQIQELKQDIQYQQQDIQGFRERQLQDLRKQYQDQIKQLQFSIEEKKNKQTKERQDQLKQLKIQIATLKKRNKKEQANYEQQYNLQNEKLKSLKASCQDQSSQTSQIQVYNIEILSQDLQKLKIEYEKEQQRKLNIDQDLATANEYINSLKERVKLFLDSSTLFITSMNQKDYHKLLDKDLILEAEISQYQKTLDKINKKVNELEPLIQSYEQKQKTLVSLMKNNPVLKDMINDKIFGLEKLEE